MFDACTALCAAMEELHVAIDGGKDSLSMAAGVGGETVKAPGSVAGGSMRTSTRPTLNLLLLLLLLRGGLLRTSTRPTLNLLLLLRASS